jgi:hypothetical protein
VAAIFSTHSFVAAYRRHVHTVRRHERGVSQTWYSVPARKAGKNGLCPTNAAGDVARKTDVGPEEQVLQDLPRAGFKPVGSAEHHALRRAKGVV